MKRAFPFQPVPGDIVFCKFPEALEATCTGPKIRPALVVDVSKDGNRVYVAYGTSQRTEQLFPGEFRVDEAAAMQMAGLCKPTKFALCRKHWLALNEEWFVVPRKHRFWSMPENRQIVGVAGSAHGTCSGNNARSPVLTCINLHVFGRWRFFIA